MGILTTLYEVLHEVHTIKIHNHHFGARNNLCQWLNTCKNAPETILWIRKFKFWSNNGLELNRWFYLWDMVTRMGEQEISTIFGKLLHNLGELTGMLQTSEQLEVLVTALVIGYLHSMYIEDITWSHRDTKFLSDFWKIFHEWPQQTSKILFQYEKRNFVSPSSHVMFSLLHTHQWNTKPFHSNSFLLWKVRFIM